MKHSLISFSLLLLLMAMVSGCANVRDNNSDSQTATGGPSFEERMATGYDITYLPTEPHSHVLLWEHAVKDMDFNTPKNARKTKEKRRLHAYKRYYEKQLGSGKLYLYHIVRDLRRRDMPLELAVIPIIESNFNPKAVSPQGAKGIWQFMPGTARHFKLTFNRHYDMRLDVIASTNAALDYFQQLYDMFGDWNVAIAAYNVGPGTVQKAIKRNKAKGLPIDLWHLKIPRAGIEYVERLYAFTDLVRNSEKYNITFPIIKYQPVFRKIDLDNRSLKEVAADTGVSLELLKQLNPGFVNPNVKTTWVDYVLVPVANYNPNIKG